MFIRPMTPVAARHGRGPRQGREPCAVLCAIQPTWPVIWARISGPIVLVGHSYGGAVITNAAVGNANVKALVHIDAFEPAAGETLQQLSFARPGSCLVGGG